LPTGVDRLTVRGIAVGDSSTNITFQRLGNRVVAFSGDSIGSAVPLLVRS
jgi:hypothetical protein